MGEALGHMKISVAIKLLSIACLLFLPDLAAATRLNPPIQVRNTAKYSNGHYNWTLYISADDAILQNINQVVYTLHPSFPNPVQTVSTRGGHCAFAFSSNSWGEFKVGVKITFKDGNEVNFEYWLNLLNNPDESGCDEKSKPSKRTRKRRG
jgi:transcription initiation factor IIF auxiliary subunit